MFTATPPPKQEAPAGPSIHRNSGRLALGSGLALLVVGAALSHFVFIGLVGFLMMPLVFGCLLTGLLQARSSSARPALQAAGLILMLLSVVLLAWVGLSSVKLAHTVAMYEQLKSAKVPAPDAARWARTIALWFAPPILWWFGIRWATAWSPGWRSTSCVACLVVPPAAMLLFQQLAKVLPISA